METDHLTQIFTNTLARVLRMRRMPGESVHDLEDAFSAALLVYTQKMARKSHLSPSIPENTDAIQGFLVRATSLIRRRNAIDAKIRADRLHNLFSCHALHLTDYSDTGECDLDVDREETLLGTNPLLRQSFMKLPDRHRTVLVECCIHGRGVAEVARQNGWLRQSVDRCRRVALKKLRQSLAEIPATRGDFAQS